MFFLRTHPKNWIDIDLEIEKPPPIILVGFLKWCLKGAYAALVLAAAASILLGIVETYIAALLGYILDLVIETPPNLLFSERWPVLLFAVSFLFLIRPSSFLLSSYLQSMVVSPGVRTMVATRLHRWTLGHSKNYFDNDFAGRIAQKEVQASNAVADVTVEVIHTVLFALASVITSFFIIATIDWRVGMIVAFWVFGFYLLMRFFLPRIKGYSADRANAQAAATGQIVDTITNISIVKLFANVRAGAIAKRADGLRLETSRGPLMADKIIIATNGYTGDLSAWHQRRVVPIASYQVATEELGSEMVTQLFPKHRMIADTKRLLYYFRPSPDRKCLLFGGRARYLHHDSTAGGLHLRRKLTAVFPQLAEVKLSHGWWGYVAYLRGGVPDLGESQPETLPGVYHALGCHGSGVVMMSWLGYRTGLLVSGQANSQSAFSGGRMAPFPLYQEKPWFLPIIGAYYQLRDWTDRWLDGKFSK